MKTEDGKVEEPGCALLRSHLGKKRKRGEARGRPSWRSSFLGHPGLARNFSGDSSKNLPPQSGRWEK